MDAKEAIELLRLVRTYHAPAPRVTRALNLAIAALEREHAERWRSVEEEAPEIGMVQWCQVHEADSRQAYIGIDGRWVDLQGRYMPVTHWRPLPAPAKEESRV